MDELLRIQGVQNQNLNAAKRVQTAQQSDVEFKQMLEQASGVNFSNHAQKRLEVRSIDMDPEKMSRLANAVDKAEAHGGKESLILMDDLAFIVNVQKRMVVTTMDVSHSKKSVFTQIDSVVIADDTAA